MEGVPFINYISVEKDDQHVLYENTHRQN